MEIAHRLKACSTIVCGGFIQYRVDSAIGDGYPYTSEEYLLKQMVCSLKNQIRQANEKTYVRTSYGYERGEKLTVHMLDNYKVDQFALFFTTVFSRSSHGSEQPFKKIHNLLRKIGFTVDDSEEIWNGKNGTYVYPCYAPVYRVLKFLDQYDEKGDLIKKEEKAEKPKRSRKKEALAA